MNKQVKRGWRSGREIVNERGETTHELFDYMKRGLQAYTNGHDKIVDCDFLLPVKRKLLAEINAEIKRDFAKSDVREISEYEIKQMVQCRYNDITGGLFDHPKGCTLMSFNKMGNNTLSEVLDFKFKAIEVDEFFNSEYSQNHLPTYEEIQKGKERKAWDSIRDRGISQEIQNETYESLLDKELQSIMLNNRSRILAGSEENSNETDNSILSIILENQSIIADLAGPEGTESERELKAWHISSRLVGSEEFRNVVSEYEQTHGIKPLEPSLPPIPQEEEPHRQEKQRSRSSGDRDMAITLARDIGKAEPTKSRAKVAKDIWVYFGGQYSIKDKYKFKGKYGIVQIKDWIKDEFPANLKKPGRQ